ncbi:MAG: hypothetical protein H7263_10615 [Candidatus Sericytochromatia bacterium]|nr:hypothetical protein [Candidatus Sericytochromatia bacterium]
MINIQICYGMNSHIKNTQVNLKMKKALTAGVILISSVIISCQNPSTNTANPGSTTIPSAGATASSPVSNSGKTDYTKTQFVLFLDCYKSNNPNDTEISKVLQQMLLSNDWDSTAQRDEYVNKYRYAINESCKPK